MRAWLKRGMMPIAAQCDDDSGIKGCSNNDNKRDLSAHARLNLVKTTELSTSGISLANEIQMK